MVERCVKTLTKGVVDHGQHGRSDDSCTVQRRHDPRRSLGHSRWQQCLDQQPRRGHVHGTQTPRDVQGLAQGRQRELHCRAKPDCAQHPLTYIGLSLAVHTHRGASCSHELAPDVIFLLYLFFSHLNTPAQKNSQ